jgi:rubredoxin
MRQLALKMNVLEAQGEALGLAPHLRELLRCPKCGLQEDALTGGALAVYFDGQPAIDSGLRFERLTNKKFLCPSCGAQVKEPPFEIPPDAFNP